MQSLEVIVIEEIVPDDDFHEPGRPCEQSVRMFTIQQITRIQRQELRVVLNSDPFRGRFNTKGTTTEDSLLVIYYDKTATGFNGFDDFFKQLFAAVTAAFGADELARVS